MKHEKTRRRSNDINTTSFPGFTEMEKSDAYQDKNGKGGARVPMRRRVTGGDLGGPLTPPPRGLSPLNPRARTPAGVSGITPSTTAASVVTNSLNAAASLTQAQKGRRPPDLLRK